MVLERDLAYRMLEALRYRRRAKKWREGMLIFEGCSSLVINLTRSNRQRRSDNLRDADRELYGQPGTGTGCR
jgi:hypothetical protein